MYRQKLSPFATILVLTMILLSACQPIQPIGESVVHASEHDDSIGSQVAGSYYVDGREFGFADSDRELTYKMLTTFTADGTVFYEVTIAFGADHPPRFKSGGHGTWQQTGAREISWTTLAFDYGQEEDHAALGPFNPYASTVRISAVTTFAEDFQSYSETGTVGVFAADVDPLDLSAEPRFPAFQGERTGRRIPALIDAND